MSAVAKGILERSYLTKQRRNLVILFEEFDLDWGWDEDELLELAEMNNSGCSIHEMNQIFKRNDPDEILLALLYLAKSGKIKRINWRGKNGSVIQSCKYQKRVE